MPRGGYKDGVDEGEYSFVQLEVTVDGGLITDISIIKHCGGGQKYADMIKPLLQQIVEKQSVEVDTITGATVSSNNVKKAVIDALQKATVNTD